MFDIGWQELFIVGILGIIVVGPKDLPRAIRTVSQMIKKARGMARDLQGSFDDVIREAELDDIRKMAETTANRDYAAELEKVVDPTGSVKKELDMSEVEGDLRDSANSFDGEYSSFKLTEDEIAESRKTPTTEEFAEASQTVEEKADPITETLTVAEAPTSEETVTAEAKTEESAEKNG